MDEVVLGISDFISDDLAYFQAGPFREGQFPLDNKCQPYVKDPFWCGDKAILKACITLYKYTCDGRVLGRDHIGLRQQCVALAGGVYKVIPDQFQAASGFGFFTGAFGILKGVTYGFAKQDLLDAWVFGQPATDYKTLSELFPADWDWTDPLPDGVTLDPGAELPPFWTPGDEVPPGLNLPPLWPEGRPKWWEERWNGGLLTERGILDVRNPLLLTEDCCVP